ncbi:DUF2460 domain-containing protein [Burkholderia gladioli]|uniref:DUF2460 domain-containing protein n=1 Tax=Burkholderia gladioli TaxID=28095 RepID=UPI001FC81568|nr:DUF2460 domain-containing protein [Burkholderia gladioli]
MGPFLESPRFPDNISFGCTVGPTYFTVLNTTYGGADGTTPAWTQAKIKFEVGRRAMTDVDTATLDAFFRCVKGRAYRFRIKDWTDFQATAAQGVLTPVSAGVYQLGKSYVTGAFSEVRTISKPVVGTVVVFLNGASVSGMTLDSTTGLVTLAPKAQASVTGITVGATTKVTTTGALSGAVVGTTVTLSGFAGADAALVNGLAFVITAIAGNVYTLNVNTTGKTITTTSTPGSVAAIYPQSTDVLAWSGQFDVPARFDVDEMKKQVVDRQGAAGPLLVSWESIPIIEVRV